MVKVLHLPAFTDFVNLKTENLKETKFDKTRLWIYIERQKTKILSAIPLLSGATRIIEKYGSIEKLPIISNQKTNAYLKEIATLVGIDKKLTSHVARKTFASILLNEEGVSMESVSKMLGHNNIAMTHKRYAKISEERIAKDMRGVT